LFVNNAGYIQDPKGFITKFFQQYLDLDAARNKRIDAIPHGIEFPYYADWKHDKEGYHQAMDAADAAYINWRAERLAEDYKAFPPKDPQLLAK